VENLGKTVKKAHVDVWVGKADHKVHRIALVMDAALDDASVKSSGVQTFAVDLDLTTVDAEAPDTSAPGEVGTEAEFQAALMGLLGKVMGGAAG
jgi:hypothetical protein